MNGIYVEDKKENGTKKKEVKIKKIIKAWANMK